MDTSPTRSTLVRSSDVHRGGPPGYAELRTYFPVDRIAARVLGVREATIADWDAGGTRCRSEAARRVALVLRACQDIAPFMTDTTVGQWMITPHPALWDRTPASLLREQGSAAHDTVIRATGKQTEIRAARRARQLLGSSTRPYPDQRLQIILAFGASLDALESHVE